MTAAVHRDGVDRMTAIVPPVVKVPMGLALLEESQRMAHAVQATTISPVGIGLPATAALRVDIVEVEPRFAVRDARMDV